jgi:hypothetical protein
MDFALTANQESIRDAVAVLRRSSSPIEDKTGDDEHGRHRQHLRERFRGRPFGGFLHIVLPGPGHDSSLRESANVGRSFYSEHPSTSIRFRLSPHSANIDGARIEW